MTARRVLADEDLSRKAMYAAPSGRLCRWLGESAEQGGGLRYSTFGYVPREGEPVHMAERFFLAQANYRILEVLW